MRGTIRLGEPLAPYTVLGLGGAADFLVEPLTEADFTGAVGVFRERGLPLLLLRRGANLLVASQGWRGAALLVDRALGSLRLEDRCAVRAGAGASLASCVEFCIRHALSGVEGLAGEEGTVGGALVRGLLPGASAPAEVRVLRDGAVVSLPGSAEPGRPGFRGIVLDVRMELPPGEKGALLRARREHLIALNRRLPVNIPGGTRMFRDPSGATAAELIARSGVRFPRRGALSVSPRNANVLLRRGAPSPEEILEFLRLIQREVRRACSVTLAPALRPVGFEEEAMREVA